ncbi:MAG: hypothetical protein RSB55_06235, partial [Oscillospiraceae bacterium]
KMTENLQNDDEGTAAEAPICSLIFCCQMDVKYGLAVCFSTKTTVLEKFFQKRIKKNQMG